MTRISLPIAVLTALLVTCSNASAAELTLTGLRHAKFKDSPSSTSGDSAVIAFAGDLALYFPGDPTCSGGDEAELMISSSLGSSGVITLPCSAWKSRNFKFQYRDRDGNAGGVKKVAFGYGKLTIVMKGASYSAIRGPSEFVEISLRIGGKVVCGRTTQFARNDTLSVVALGPSSKCFYPIEAPPPTATMTETATATSTATETPIPPLPTSTPTPTASPTLTGTTTGTPTSTASETPTTTETPTQTFTPTQSATVTRTPTRTPTPSASPTASPEPDFVVDIAAYRPQSEGYASPLPRLAIPGSEEEAPGAGIRINGDDDDEDGIADFNDTQTANENDMIEITLSAQPNTAPAGYEYVLARSGPHLKVWTTTSKTFAILGANDEARLVFDGSAETYWVEGNGADAQALRIEVRRTADGTTKTSDTVQFRPFGSIVIALGGENQTPSYPINSDHGMFAIAAGLYALGYDVHMYDEDNVGNDGSGAVYDEVVSAIRERGVHVVAIYGYSHGGGSAYDLAARLNDNRASIGTFTLPFTAYVDGVENDNDIDLDSEVRLPPATQYHLNYYQRSFIPMGDSVSGASFNFNLTSSGAQHGNIDERADVRTGVQDAILQRIPR